MCKIEKSAAERAFEFFLILRRQGAPLSDALVRAALKFGVSDSYLLGMYEECARGSV
jgi:hypothetical protein